jgi:hypothetical protein
VTDLAQRLDEQVSGTDQLIGAHEAGYAERREDEALERRRRGLVGVGEDFPQSDFAFGDNGVGDLLLGLEVVVERTLGDAGLPDDGGQVGIAVARVGEQLDRGVDDLAAGHLSSRLSCHPSLPVHVNWRDLSYSSITAAGL